MIPTLFPLVTIAIPTYNRAEGYLRHAIGCALAQTYRNIEIVISDNCSSDSTGEIVKGYADSRIRYFRQQVNIGANNNFNFCLEKARGHYFILLHDDDAIDADFVELCMRSACYRTGIGIIRTGARVIDGEGNTKSECRNLSGGSPLGELFLSWFSGATPIYLCNTLFYTAGLREIGGFVSRTNLYQDVVAQFRVAAGHGRLDVPDVKAGFRRHLQNRGSAAAVRDWSEDSLFLLEVMCDVATPGKDLIRERGLVYFCAKNYRIAASIRSPLRRIATYLAVYRKFGYRYSPLSFILSRRGRRFKRFFKMTMKQAESEA
jgi:glycosyltransferase involved in cell wall biosynthesis